MRIATMQTKTQRMCRGNEREHAGHPILSPRSERATCTVHRLGSVTGSAPIMQTDRNSKIAIGSYR